MTQLQFEDNTEPMCWVECFVDDERTSVSIHNYTAMEAAMVMKVFLDSIETEEDNE